MTTTEIPMNYVTDATTDTETKVRPHTPPPSATRPAPDRDVSSFLVDLVEIVVLELK